MGPAHKQKKEEYKYKRVGFYNNGCDVTIQVIERSQLGAFYP